MKIWTIQPPEVYEKVIENGILHVDENGSFYISEAKTEKRHGNCWTFLDCYNWMVSMMDKFNIKGKPDNVNYPWWGWFLFNGKHKNPIYDLMCLVLLEKKWFVLNLKFLIMRY